MLRTASFWGVCTHPGERVKRPRASRVEPLYDGTVSLEERALAGLWPWEPITPRDVAEVLAGFQAPWWIAGGSAIELFLGRTTRRRYDLDLAILRRDQLALRRHLADWDLHLATPERRLYPWDGRFLELPVARFWVRRKPGTPWWLDGRLEEARGERWFYRLDERISLPLSEFGRTSDEGIPFLAPEVALFYMLISPTPKAKADFLATHTQLGPASRAWLKQALATCRPGYPLLPLL
jgi:Aminoglycoside-2''-adenylyltransferase